MKLKLRWWHKVSIGLVVAGAVLAGVYLSVIGTQRWSCEVCITYNGATDCRKASAPTQQDAVRTAATTACAFLASGMTERIACPNTPPTRRVCRER